MKKINAHPSQYVMVNKTDKEEAKNSQGHVSNWRKEGLGPQFFKTQGSHSELEFHFS